MSNTPRVDALCPQPPEGTVWEDVVALARSLERENAALKSAARVLLDCNILGAASFALEFDALREAAETPLREVHSDG